MYDFDMLSDQVQKVDVPYGIKEKTINDYFYKFCKSEMNNMPKKNQIAIHKLLLWSTSNVFKYLMIGIGLGNIITFLTGPELVISVVLPGVLIFLLLYILYMFFNWDLSFLNMFSVETREKVQPLIKLLTIATIIMGIISVPESIFGIIEINPLISRIAIALIMLWGNLYTKEVTDHQNNFTVQQA